MHEIGCRTNSFCLKSLRQRLSCSQQSGRALRNLNCRQGYPLLPRIQVTSHRRRRRAAGDIELRIALRTAPCRCTLEAFSLRRQRRPDSLRVSSRASSTSVSAEKELGADPQNLTGLVESSMLAACTGLAYHFSASFRLESYVGALFPLPVVLAAARWGCRAAWKTLVTTSLLLLLLGGPLRSATYILLHGSLGITIGMLWSKKRHWLLSVPATAVVRSAGVFGSLLLSSLLLRENVLALIITQVCALVDQMLASIGAGATPELSWAYGAAVALILVNSLSYCMLLHLLYHLLLGRVDSKAFGNAPAWLRRAFTTTSP